MPNLSALNRFGSWSTSCSLRRRTLFSTTIVLMRVADQFDGRCPIYPSVPLRCAALPAHIYHRRFCGWSEISSIVLVSFIVETANFVWEAGHLSVAPTWMTPIRVVPHHSSCLPRLSVKPRCAHLPRGGRMWLKQLCDTAKRPSNPDPCLNPPNTLIPCLPEGLKALGLPPISMPRCSTLRHRLASMCSERKALKFDG
jgi:hypothetical protein